MNKKPRQQKVTGHSLSGKIKGNDIIYLEDSGKEGEEGKFLEITNGIFVKIPDDT